MKYIKVPEPIVLRDPKTSQQGTSPDSVVSFRDFLYLQVLTDARWYEPKTRLVSLLRLQGKIDAATTSLDLEDADYAILKDIVERPAKGFMHPNPLLQAQLIAFDKAVLSASDEPSE
jgi:hypothetical protein